MKTKTLYFLLISLFFSSPAFAEKKDSKKSDNKKVKPSNNVRDMGMHWKKKPNKKKKDSKKSNQKGKPSNNVQDMGMHWKKKPNKKKKANKKANRKKPRRKKK